MFPELGAKECRTLKLLDDPIASPDRLRRGSYTFIEHIDDLSQITDESPPLLVFIDVQAAATYFNVTEEVMEEVFEVLDANGQMATESAIATELKA